MGDQMRRAWEDWLSAEAAAQPVALVLEDLQWGDLPTVKFVDAALRNLADRPILVLALARPEVHELFPGLWSERGVAELRLGELTRRAAERLVKQVLGDRVDADTTARLVERAAGNAFYLEELIRAAAAGPVDELPGTVLAMVQARLEALDPTLRQLLRAASVFGRVFWSEGVRGLVRAGDAPAALAEMLTALEARELIVRHGESRFPTSAEWAFRHALVRDASYATLTDGDARAGHRLAADWLEQAGAVDAMAMAEHRERAHEPARAVRWYLRAAAQALEGNDFEGVLGRVKKGIAAGATGEVLGELLLLETEAHSWKAEIGAAWASCERAVGLLPECGTLWCRAMGELAVLAGRNLEPTRVPRLIALRDQLLAREPAVEARAAFLITACRLSAQLYTASHVNEATPLQARIEALAADVDDPSVRGWLKEGRAFFRVWSTGLFIAGQELFDEAAREFERAGDLRNALAQRVNLGFNTLAAGQFEETVRNLGELVIEANRLGLGRFIPAARLNMGISLAYLGRFDEAQRALDEAIALARQGDQRLIVMAQIYLATLQWLKGDAAGALRLADELLAERVEPRGMRYAHTLKGVLLCDLGRPAEALQELHAARAIGHDFPGIVGGEVRMRLIEVRALEALGDHDRARTVALAGRDWLLALASTCHTESTRASYLASPDCAGLLALAARLAA
jgi:tetratricopeptide (TPR) repeat protein